MKSSEIINDFFSNPIKYGEDGSVHDLRLSSLRKEEVNVLFEIVKMHKPLNTIEIGLALSASCIAIVLAKKEFGLSAKHTVLDPFQASLTKNAGIIELERLSLIDYVEHKNEYSEIYLTNSYKNSQNYDFIFIDGSHTIGQAVTDAFLSDKVLNHNGIIMIHDALLFSTAASIKYLLWEKIIA